jgi:hypothetical protein
VVARIEKPTSFTGWPTQPPSISMLRKMVYLLEEVDLLVPGARLRPRENYP